MDKQKQENRPASLTSPSRERSGPASGPKIGLALSGGSGKAISYIGVIEVFEEHDIPIDYITACSSGTIIAGSYACGTMQKLKNDWLSLDKKFILRMFELGDTGQAIFTTDKFANWIRQYIDKRFEDVKPRLGFVSADLKTGTPVVLSLGDIVRAAQASCAVPGLFEPVEWGNMLLADGGLVCAIPASQAKEMGADIVIGVDILSRRHVFTRKTIQYRKRYNLLKESSLFQPIRFLSKQFSKFRSALMLEEQRHPSVFSILGDAMNIVIDVEKHDTDNQFCDVLLAPNVKNATDKIGLKASRVMYEEGRRCALVALPEIERLIKKYQ